MQTGERPNLGNNYFGNFSRRIEPRIVPPSQPRQSQNEATEKEGARKMEKILNGVINISLFALFFGLPLFFTGLTLQGISFEKQMYFYFWILIALIAWGAKSSYLGEMKIRRTPLDIPIIVFWLFYIVATVVSVDRWHSLIGAFGEPSRGFLSVTAMVIAYYLIVSNVTINSFRWMIRGLMISGGFVVVWSILAILNLLAFIPEKIGAYLPLNFVGSMTSLVILASLLVPIFMMAVLKLQNDATITNIRRRIYSVLIILFLAADLFLLLLVYTYVPWMGILIGSVLFLIFILSKIVRTKDVWTLLPMVTFVVIITFLLIGNLNLSKANLPLSVSVPYKAAVEIAKGSLKDKFFTGYGTAEYGYAFSKHLPAGFDNMNVRFYGGEGIMLESLSTIGAIGAVLLAIVLLTLLGSTLFLLSRDKEKNKLYSLGIITATIIVLIDITLIRAESIVLILFALMGALSMAIVSEESQTKDNSIRFSLKASPKFALTLSFITLLIFASVAFLFVFLGKAYIADVYMGLAARRDMNDSNIATMTKAVQLNGKEGRYFSRIGQAAMILANDEMLKDEADRNTDKLRSYVVTAVNSAKRGEELMPQDVASVEVLALIYENSRYYLDNALEAAQNKYSRALELEPNSPFFIVKLGEIKIAMIDPSQKIEEKKKIVEEAKGMFQKAIDIRGTYAPAYYNIALTKEALEDLDSAINDMSTAVKLQRNNINYVFNLGRLYQERGKDEDNKIAEMLFKQILGVNDKELNTHFNLGLLYEKTDRKAEAINEYKKVLDLLPAKSEQARTQIEKMISNIQNGIENTPENLGLTGGNQ